MTNREPQTLHVTKVQSRAPRTVWLVTHADKIYTWNFVNGSNGNAASTKKVLKGNSTALKLFMSVINFEGSDFVFRAL